MNENPTRYFHIAYVGKNYNGSIQLPLDKYPSRDYITTIVRGQDPKLVGNPIIINILELTEQDYNDFTEKI